MVLIIRFFLSFVLGFFISGFLARVQNIEGFDADFFVFVTWPFLSIIILGLWQFLAVRFYKEKESINWKFAGLFLFVAGLMIIFFGLQLMVIFPVVRFYFIHIVLIGLALIFVSLWLISKSQKIQMPNENPTSK